MKILFLGDSITDMGRNRETDGVFGLGTGYPFFVAGELYSKRPGKYEILNRGISGNRSVDLYARIKSDVWNEMPEVLSILVGTNDVWHELNKRNGVEIDRFEKVYRMIIEDTLNKLPEIKIVLMEPFVLKGKATEEDFENFSKIKEYAKVVERLAEEYKLYFVPLQEKFDAAAKKGGAENYLYDGVHPHAAGAKLIAGEWLKVFKNQIEKEEN